MWFFRNGGDSPLAAVDLGYVDHDHQAFAPDPTLFRHYIEQARGLTGSLLNGGGPGHGSPAGSQ